MRCTGSQRPSEPFSLKNFFNSSWYVEPFGKPKPIGLRLISFRINFSSLISHPFISILICFVDPSLAIGGAIFKENIESFISFEGGDVADLVFIGYWTPAILWIVFDLPTLFKIIF